VIALPWVARNVEASEAVALAQQIGLQSDPFLRIASNRFGRISPARACETVVRKQRFQKLVSLPHVARRDARRTNSLEIMMSNPAHQSDVQINRIHSGAICKEMGERLSARLGPQSNELPARLLALMEQLEKVEHRDSSAN
jgi:hypothetical protein